MLNALHPNETQEYMNEIDSTTLSFIEVQQEQEGVYTCHASNTVGISNMFSSADVDVLCE